MSGHKPDFAFLSEKRGQEIAEKAFCMMIPFLRGDVFVNILSTNNKFQSQMVLIKPQLEILLSFVTRGAFNARLVATINLSAGSPWNSPGSRDDKTAISGDN